MLICLAISALLLPNKAYQDARQQTRITIAKDTSYLTEPLDDEGYVDYGEAINLQNSKGVTQENNAVIPIRLMTGNFGLEAREKEYCRRIGLTSPLRKSELDCLFVHNSPQDLRTFTAGAWSELEFDQLESWLSEHDRQLAIIRSAAARDRFYSPTIIAGEGLWGSPLLDASDFHYCARTFLARAILNLRQGREGLMFDDIATARRLAEHQANGWTQIERMIGGSIREEALRVEATYLNHGKPNRLKRKLWERRLEKIRKPKTASEVVRNGTRIMTLDFATAMARGQLEARQLRDWNPAFDDLSAAVFLLRVRHPDVDWNKILRTLNKEFDFLGECFSADNPEKQLQLFTEFDRRFEQFKLKAQSYKPTILATNPAGLTDFISALIVYNFLDAVKGTRQAELRGLAREDCVRVAWGLAIYRVEKQTWPEELNQLVPDYLPSLPTDRFDGKPLRYKVSDGDAIVYSVGINLKDDEEEFDERGGWRDIGVRLLKR